MSQRIFLKGIFFVFILNVMLLSIVPIKVSATQIIYVKGHISDIENYSSSSVSDILGVDLSVGDIFFGTMAYQYDPTAVDFMPSVPDFGWYFSDSVGGYWFTTTNGLGFGTYPNSLIETFILNNIDFSMQPSIDLFEMYCIEGDSNALDWLIDNNLIRLIDSTGNVFSDDSLPMFLDANAFDSGEFVFHGLGGDFFTIYGTIDRISNNPIPEPATMLLLGSGILGLAGFRRRFRKR